MRRLRTNSERWSAGPLSALTFDPGAYRSRARPIASTPMTRAALRSRSAVGGESGPMDRFQAEKAAAAADEPRRSELQLRLHQSAGRPDHHG
jgi:hypothetical protein